MLIWIGVQLGDYSWKVKTANSIGEGPWSETMSFSVTAVAYRVHGLNFSPYVDGQDPNQGAYVEPAQLQSRMEIVQPYTRWIRTYGSTHGLEHSGKIAHNLGLKAAVGAWISNNATDNDVEIENLISAGLAGYADMLIVGSEVLLRDDHTEGQLIAYIHQVRQAVPGVPVSYSDVYHVLEDHPAVIDAVDIVLVNYFPYWEGKHVERAISNIHCWHARMLELADGKPVIVGETGWPSAGDTIGLAEPSMHNAGIFFLDFVTWARANSVDYFYFSALDESWKAAYEGPQGAHWGVWDKSGVMKPGMMAVFNNASSSNTWNYYCGSGEPAIDFTHVPPYGSYENLEGQAYHIEPDDFKVAVYIYVGGWWTKPYWASPTTSIAADGTWICDITTGGADHTARRIIAFLIPAAWSPPLMSGGGTLPQSLYDNSVAWLETTRSP